MNAKAVLELIRVMTAPLSARLNLLVTRGTVTRVSDGDPLQRLQVKIFDEDPHSDVEHFQPYGLTGHPLVGTEAVVLARGGSRSHLLVIGVDDRGKRPGGLAPGEVKLYDHLGQYVHFKQDGSWEFKAITDGKMIAPAGVKIEAPFLHCTGEIKDRCDSDGKTMSEMRATHDDHDHGGITPGGGTTNKPNQLMGGH